MLFDAKDFPPDKFPEEFSVGICAKCPDCGQLNFSGGTDFAMTTLNAQKVREMKEHDGEVINVCIMCLIKMIGAENMREYCEETTAEIKKM